MLFEVFEVTPKYKSFPTKLLDAIRLLLLIAAPFSSWAKSKSELIKIAKYYATESMLIWDENKLCFDPIMTPSTGQDTLEQYFHAINNQRIELEIHRDSKL